MKKTAFLLLLALIAAAPSFAASFPEEFKRQNTTAAPEKAELAPMELQQRFDYTGGPASSPVYVGFAPAGAATSASKWMVWKYTYSGSDPTLKQTSYGTWDDRATLTYS